MRLLPTIAAAVLFAVFASPAIAQAFPTVVDVSASSAPPHPRWLKVACMKSGDTLAASPTCPIVHYKGVTTWVYSFVDNRSSFALVTYDDQNRIVSSVTKDGARYVWRITFDPSSRSITIFGQSNRSVTAQLFEVSRGLGMDNYDIYSPSQH